MSTLTPPVPHATSLRQRLATLRWHLRLVAAFRGTSWLLTAVLATGLLVGLLDWRFQLPSLARAVALVALLAGAGVIAYRHLLRPLSARSDDLTLALRVEDHYPGLNDALASTVQFLDQPGAPGGASAPLQGEAVRRALHKAAGFDFDAVIDRRGLRLAGLSAALAGGAAVALVALFPALAATAVVRLANPFGGADWPKKTRLVLEAPRERVGRNEPYQIKARVLGVVPAEATVELTFDGFGVTRRTFRVADEGEGVGGLLAHLRPEEVQRNFRFRVSANDALTREYAVEVLPPPTLVPFDGRPSPQLRLTFPRYTDLPSPHHLSPGNGNVEAVTGTSVSLRAAADRPLRRAWIEYEPQVRETPQASAVVPFGVRGPVATVSALVATRALADPVRAELGPDRGQFTVDFRPHLDGLYTLYFEDETGLRGKRQFELRLRPDPAPTVRLERPSPARDVLTVLPTAELTLEVVAEDTQYALRSAFLEYRLQGEEAVRAVPLYRHATGLARALAPFAGALTLAAPVPRLRPTRLEFRQALSLKDLRRADGSALKDGDVVVLQAAADDFDDVAVGKEPGRSHQVEIRVVGREALDLVVNQEQGRIQQDLLRLREKESEALKRVAGAEQRLRKGGKLVPDREARQAAEQAEAKRAEAAREEEQAEKAAKENDQARREKHEARAQALRKQAEELARLARDLDRQANQIPEGEQLQQQIRERVGDQKEGLRAEVARLREALRQNGLRNTNAADRMGQVARELDRLAQRELQQIEPRLSGARRLAELLDEKARAERQAELERSARQAEADARAAEETAKRAERDATRAEQRAEKAGDERERERQAAEARRLRDRAGELRQKAGEQRAQGARDRRDAAQKPDEAQPREALAEARRGQEEVEKTLNDLLQRLEPFSSTREVKGEAGRLLQEQKQALADLEELARKEKDLTGKPVEDLTPQQKAELGNLRDTQRRLEERANKLLNQMKSVAKEREAKDRETARELGEAADQAERNNLVGKMKTAGERIKENKLNEARSKQREAVAELERLVKNLEDRREAELDRLIKKLRQAEEEVAKLAGEQERLQKKMREAGKIGDEARRKEELRKLARQQKELQRKAAEVVEQLSRLRSERARQALAQANEEMGEANQQLSRGERDDEKQEDVLDRLDEARRELEQARKQAEEELGREQLARVADVLKRIRDRQDVHRGEAVRIQTDVQQRGSWTRGLRASLSRLAENQKGLGAETAEVARRDLGGAPVFAKLVKRSAEAMEHAGRRLGIMVKEPPDAKALPDAVAAQSQGLAQRRLEQLLEALKGAQAESPQPLNKPGGGSGGGGEGGGDKGGDDSIPPPAQLKLLRAMQKELNERTEAFRKGHPALEKLGAKEKAELKALRREQKEIADLLEELTRPAADRGEAEGDKQ